MLWKIKDWWCLGVGKMEEKVNGKKKKKKKIFMKRNKNVKYKQHVRSTNELFIDVVML